MYADNKIIYLDGVLDVDEDDFVLGLIDCFFAGLLVLSPDCINLHTINDGCKNLAYTKTNQKNSKTLTKSTTITIINRKTKIISHTNE